MSASRKNIKYLFIPTQQNEFGLIKKKKKKLSQMFCVKNVNNKSEYEFKCVGPS